MSLINSISGFCIKNKRIICLIIFIILAIFLHKLSASMKEKEGLELNSCDLFNSNQKVEKTCANCLGVTLLRGDANSKCYWNSRLNKCGSFLDTGYSNTCTSSGSSSADSATSGSSSGPTLQLLDTPTWLADPTQNSNTPPKLTLVDTPTWITKS